MFPEEIPRRLIRMFTFVGDTVLDPFLGSGTTSLAARNLDRNSVGYEVNPEFVPVIRRKLGIDDKLLFEGASFELMVQDKPEVTLDEKAAQLPYVFKDPVQFDKKVDPRTLQFGSKVNHQSGQRQEYYRVQEVLSPERLVLSDGVHVRLLGVKTKSETRRQAIQFLEDKTSGQRVAMRFDAVKHDKDNNLLCYLYLENRTFLNAHLVKSGLVATDTQMEYRLRERFTRLAQTGATET
jgi:site-specific DNA-methyltransferase (adenine-specific)